MEPRRTGKDIDGAAVRLAAAAVGWHEVEVMAQAPGRPRVAVEAHGAAAALMAALSTLVDASARADWWLEDLTFSQIARGRGKVEATFAAGHGVVTARGMAVSGHRPGPESAIGQEVLDRIAQLLADGLTYRAVAAKLDEERVPPPGGGLHWRHATVHAAAQRRGSTG